MMNYRLPYRFSQGVASRTVRDRTIMPSSAERARDSGTGPAGPVAPRTRSAEETDARIRATASAVLSCSHTRRTVHPAAVSARSFLRSRVRVASSLAAHHSALVFGKVPCWGHPCQKQPSMNTATREPGKIMSASQRRAATGLRCLKKRRPARWRADRRATSGAVFRGRFDCIDRRTAGLLAHDSMLL
jgi:hypothetical protein